MQRRNFDAVFAKMTHQERADYLKLLNLFIGTMLADKTGDKRQQLMARLDSTPPQEKRDYRNN